MYNVLTNEEIEQLSQFRFTPEKKSSELSVPLSELLEEKSLLCYLEKVKNHIGAPNVKVTASIFTKRYAFLVVIYFYAITVWNKKLDISFHNIQFQKEKEADNWLPQFYFHHTQIEIADENRSAWLEECIRCFFSQNTNILMTQLANVTKQSILVLWENIATYLFWLYESVLEQSDNQSVKIRARADFHYIVNEASGTLFGNYDQNPLKIYYCNKKCVLDKQEIRVRSTCCFSYLLEGACKTCKTCPRTCAKLNNDLI